MQRPAIFTAESLRSQPMGDVAAVMNSFFYELIESEKSLAKTKWALYARTEKLNQLVMELRMLKRGHDAKEHRNYHGRSRYQ